MTQGSPSHQPANPVAMWTALVLAVARWGRPWQHTWERDGQRHSRLAVVADQVSFGPNPKGAGGETSPAEGDEKDDLPF